MVIPSELKSVFKWLGDLRESDHSLTSYHAADEPQQLVLCMLAAIYRWEAKLFSWKGGAQTSHFAIILFRWQLQLAPAQCNYLLWPILWHYVSSSACRTYREGWDMCLELPGFTEHGMEEDMLWCEGYSLRSCVTKKKSQSSYWKMVVPLTMFPKLVICYRLGC